VSRVTPIFKKKDASLQTTTTIPYPSYLLLPNYRRG